MVLQADGHQLMAVISAGAALKAVEQNKFDLVITDLIMPDKDGLEMIMALRKNSSTVPILAISGGGRV